MQKKQSSDNSAQAFGKLFSDTNEKKNKLRKAKVFFSPSHMAFKPTQRLLKNLVVSSFLI